MISFFLVNKTRGITAKGSPKLSTTWLIMRVLVGSKPISMTIIEGITVTIRLIKIGMWKRMKPCMTTCPDIVPTADEEMPDASNEMAKIVLEALPSKGESVL